jgi:hypothetical protein
MDVGSILILTGLTVLIVAFIARPLAERRSRLVTAEEHALSGLQAERDKILAMIRETEMDHAMGKIPDGDFEAQRAALVAQGAALLRAIDAQGGAAPAPAAADDLDAAIEAAVASRRAPAAAGGAAGFCTTCGQALQGGDRFCARCGAPVPQEVQA